MAYRARSVDGRKANDDRSLRSSRKSGPADACAFDTLSLGPDTDRSRKTSFEISILKGGSGLFLQ
jgi:hypothetical protein